MSLTLTPLPSPHPGIAPASAGVKTWNVLPFPQPHNVSTSAPQPTPLPAWPSANPSAAAGFPKTWPSPLSVLPSATPPPPIESPAPPVTIPSNEPDFTDDDLRVAFSPIVEEAVRKAVYAKENGIDTYLEPMLRATIRRALAEYAPASRPFQQPGAMDRFIWHVQALFTSRTYEDIFFEKTRRFQVEEVFLLDAASLALVSYASCDPARHSAARRVSGTVQRLALQLRDDDKKIRTTFELTDKRSVISREGSHVVLMALVRGTPGELLFADLEFALRRIEDHFRAQFQQQGSNLLFALQPFLEDCLLIQSPASAA